MASKIKILHLSRQNFIIVKKELDYLTQVLRNWPLKMWRPKDRSMTVRVTEYIPLHRQGHHLSEIVRQGL